jgi:hypothetical protein
MKQVLAIDAAGGIAGLQAKSGRGIDLRKMGHAKIDRVSDIRWDEKHQSWYVDILHGTDAGPLTLVKMNEVGLLLVPTKGTRYGILLWDEYEDAVAGEIAYVNACLLSGEQSRIGVEV